MERAAYCGLFCGACPVFIVNQSGKLKEFASGGNLSEGDLECTGCRSEKVAVFCSQCSIRKCGKQKNHESCLDCADYPCADYIKFRDDPNYLYHLDAPAQMIDMRKKGIPVWLKEMEQKWTCPDCGNRVNWHSECVFCGKRK